MGYTAAATYLSHSMQLISPDLSFDSDHAFSQEIFASSECQAILSDLRNRISKQQRVQWAYSDSTILDRTTGLKMAYNKVDYALYAIKENGVWNVSITFTDTYDFTEWMSWREALANDTELTAILNNYAVQAQVLGVIHPFNLTLVVETSFTT